jgi:superfamily II DNA or RNA helicase
MVGMQERRRFNTRERVAAFLIAGGKCEDCGEELKPGWHGDHDIAYSMGGVTDVTNIQALCPKCNWKKGNKPMKNELGPWIDRDDPRIWQDEAMDFIKPHSNSDFLVAACPAAGKTILGLRAAHFKLFSGQCNFLTVIAHTDEIRRQWINEAHEQGINLCLFKHADGQPQDGFHGCVVTYQQVASMPSLYEVLCARYDVMVIFDEVHHAGDKNSWGSKIKQAFNGAKFRLSLSGTPFRGDDTAIPFLNYVDGICKPDYSYPYWRGIKENVCRVVEFPSWNADVTWHIYDEKNDTVISKTVDFNEDVREDDRAKRLRHALYDDDYLIEMVKAGNELLQNLRRERHSDAGGLIIAMHQAHAEQVRRIIQRVTGFNPRVVISDNEYASKDIDTFRNNAEPWIVAVKMFSEGVSVRRLRVCVYATNIVTDISFIQAVGRIIRRIDDNDEMAYFIMPKDPLFIEHSKKIEQDVIRAVEEEDKGIELKKRNTSGMLSSITIIPGGTDNQRRDDSIYRGESYGYQRLETITSILGESGLAISPIQALAVMDKMHRMGLYNDSSANRRTKNEINHSGQTKLARTEASRKKADKLAKKYAILQSKLTRQSPSYSRVYRQLDNLVGRDYKTGSEEELLQCCQWLEKHIEAIQLKLEGNDR